MRTFEHFPKDQVCPICNTNEDKECTLVPIDGTEDGNICEAKCMHVSCLTECIEHFCYNEQYNVLHVRL